MADFATHLDKLEKELKAYLDYCNDKNNSVPQSYQQKVSVLEDTWQTVLDVQDDLLHPDTAPRSERKHLFNIRVAALQRQLAALKTKIEGNRAFGQLFSNRTKG